MINRLIHRCSRVSDGIQQTDTKHRRRAGVARTPGPVLRWYAFATVPTGFNSRRRRSLARWISSVRRSSPPPIARHRIRFQRRLLLSEDALSARSGPKIIRRTPIASRFGTEGSEVQILSPRPTFRFASSRSTRGLSATARLAPRLGANPLAPTTSPRKHSAVGRRCSAVVRRDRRFFGVSSLC